MLTAKTSELELMQGWFNSDRERARVRVAFPINKWTGSRDSAVVYFEVETGRPARPPHTDSAEEILYMVAGEAEAEVGGQRRRPRQATSRSSPPWFRTASTMSAMRRSRSWASSQRPKSSRPSVSRCNRLAQRF